MKRFISLIIVLLFCQSTVNAEVPLGVSATKIIIDGSVDNNQEGGYELINGLPGTRETGEPYDGLWDGIKIGSIEYTLSFWNVGEEGGTSGMLFWKKDYSDAALTIRYIPSSTGSKYKFNGYMDKEKKSFPTFKISQPGNYPEFDTITYHLKFSGGPYGTFEEKGPTINSLGKPLTGEVINGGTILLRFPTSEPDQTSKYSRYSNPILVNKIGDETIVIPGNPFFGWVVQEEACVDSGARFSSISKVVDIFPHSNPDNMRSATMHSILCVNDHVLTGEESSAIVTLADLSTITLKEESEIVIESPPKEKSRLEVLGGRLKMNIKKVLAGEDIEVKSNLATIGIKGTTFILDIDETHSTLEVLEGTVEFTSTATGKKELVTDSETVTADSAGLSQKTTFDAEAETKNWPEIKSEKNNPAPILLLIIVLLIAAGAGFYFVKKKKRPHN